MIFQTSIEFYTRVFVAKDYYSRWSGGPNLLPESSRVCQLVSRAHFAEASKLSHDLPVKIGLLCYHQVWRRRLSHPCSLGPYQLLPKYHYSK